MHKWVALTCFPRDDVRTVRMDELRILYAMVNKIKIAPVQKMVRQWHGNFRMIGPVECTSLVTRIATSLGVLNWARFTVITTPRQSIDLAYLVQGHTLKSAPDGSIVFFFPGYVNDIPLPYPRLHLYKSRGYTFELQPAEAPRRSSVSGRMTTSRSRNAAMDMPPPQPQAFQGYAGYAPTAGAAGPSSRQQSSWDRYIPQPDAGGSSWQSAGSSEWDQSARMNWAYASGSSSSGAPPLFAARCSFSARGYRDLSQGIHDLNIRVGDIDDRMQQTQGALTQHIQDTP